MIITNLDKLKPVNQYLIILQLQVLHVNNVRPCRVPQVTVVVTLLVSCLSLILTELSFLFDSHWVVFLGFSLSCLSCLILTQLSFIDSHWVVFHWISHRVIDNSVCEIGVVLWLWCLSFLYPVVTKQLFYFEY